MKEAAWIGGLLFVAGGCSVIAVALFALRWTIDGFEPVGLGAMGGGAVLTGWGVLAVPERWVTERVVFWMAAAATVYISAGQIAFAGPRGFAPVLLLWPLLWAFAFLSRPRAMVIGALALAGGAAIFAFQEGWSPPAAYWLFLASTFVATAYIVFRLVGRVEALADAERGAREELAGLNRTLEERVERQLEEMARLARLRRFLSPSVADAVVSAEDGEWLAPHRAEIAVLFCDMRGFTAFSASAEPEDVTGLLARFHEAAGGVVERHQATVGGFAGDGLWVYFNDPIPCPDPVGAAVALAVELAEPMDRLRQQWRLLGFDIGYGVGIALGHATMATVGFESRRDYTALGTVVNLASRLSDEAADGEVLLDPRAWNAVRDTVPTAPVGELELKGFARPVAVYRVLRAEPALSDPPG